MGGSIISLEVERAIDLACDRFEEEWSAGKPPRIEDLLPTDDSAPEMLYQLLLLELELRARGGDSPNMAEYLDRFSDHATTVHRAFMDSTTLAYPGAERAQGAAAIYASNGHFGRYELLGLLGKGAMGVVHRARDPHLKREVALKRILIGSDEEQVVRRFKMEAEAAARLRHEGIVTVYEVGEFAGQYYYTMELIDGATLSERIRDQQVTPTEAATIAMRIADAVAYAHDCGVIHRDLKPANILLDYGQTPRIADFGLAMVQDAHSRLTATGGVLGTPAYMSPEQTTGSPQQVNHLADVYALGAILYALLTGKPPFGASTLQETLRQVRQEEPARPRSINRACPRDLETICLVALQKEPQRRYQSAHQLRDDLQRFLSGKPIQARPISSVGRAYRWCRRHPSLASFVGALILLVMLLGTLAIRENQRARAESAALAREYQNSIRLAMQRADWESVLATVANAEQDDAMDRVSLALHRVRALQGLGRLTDARRLLEELFQQADNRRRADVLLWYGDDLICRGRMEEGRRYITQAKKIGLSAADDHYADAQLAENGIDALKALRKTLDVDPFHYNAHSQLSVTLFLTGHRTEAAEHAKGASLLFPDAHVFPSVLALSAAAEEKVEESKLHLKEASRALDEPRTKVLAELCVLLSDISQRLRIETGYVDIQAAIRDFSKMAKLLKDFRDDPSVRVPEALQAGYPEMMQAIALAPLSWTRKLAYRSLDRAIEKRHPDGYLELIRATLLFEDKKFGEAADAYAKTANTPAFLVGVRREALYGAAMAEAAAVHIDKDEEHSFAQAAAYLRERIRLGPLKGHQAMWAAGIARLAGDYTLGLQILDAWQKVDPQSLSLCVCRVKLELAEDHYGAACRHADTGIQLAQQALQSNPKDTNVTTTLADLERLRREAAEKWRKSWAELSPAADELTEAASPK